MRLSLGAPFWGPRLCRSGALLRLRLFDVLREALQNHLNFVPGIGEKPRRTRSWDAPKPSQTIKHWVFSKLTHHEMMTLRGLFLLTYLVGIMQTRDADATGNQGAPIPATSEGISRVSQSWRKKNFTTNHLLKAHVNSARWRLGWHADPTILAAAGAAPKELHQESLVSLRKDLTAGCSWKRPQEGRSRGQRKRWMTMTMIKTR